MLLRKPRVLGEVYNDLDGNLFGLFTVLRNPLLAGRLQVALSLTPYSREEFEASYEPTEEPVEAARPLIVRSFMGFGSASCNVDHKTGFRGTISRKSSTRAQRGPAYEWATYSDIIPALTQRLRGVVIENRPALEVLQRHDDINTLHYVDPPYPFLTRGNNAGVRQKYRFELADDDHRELATALHSLAGMVVLSGYACDLYDVELYAGWKRCEKVAYADGGRERTEVLWLNPAAANAIPAGLSRGLFD